AGLLFAIASLAAAQAPDPGEAPPPVTAPAPAVRVLRTGGLRIETAALLLSGQQGGPVPLAVLAIPLPGVPSLPGAGARGGDRVRVAVAIEAAGAALSAALAEVAGEAPAPVDVALYALDARGALAGSLLETVEIPRPADELARTGLRFWGGLSLRPGEYSLRVLVGHAASRTLGLKSVPLSVPAAGASTLETPLLASAAPAAGPPPWLTVESLDAGKLDLPAWWRPPPPARPLVTAESEPTFTVPALGLPAGTAPRLALRPSGGGAEIELPVRETARRTEGRLERIDLAAALHGIAPGAYELLASARGPDGATLASPPLPVDVVAAGEPARVWAEQEGGGNAAAPAALASGGAEEPGRGRWRRSEVAALRASYRRALGLLAAGDFTAARKAVSAFEASLLSGENPANLD